MTDRNSATDLGNRILLLEDRDSATQLCVDVRQAIERRDQRIAELEREIALWKKHIRDLKSDLEETD